METVTTVILMVLGFISFLALATFGLFSFWEQERRAARVAFGLAVLTAAPFLLASRLPPGARMALLGLVAAGLVVGVILFLLPIGRVERGNDIPRQRFDERDMMFARARLVPGSPEHTAYYARRPENLTSDEKTRALPGLLSPTAPKANPLAFASAQASFCLTEELREEVDGPVAEEKTNLTPARATTFVKDIARYYGAGTAGVATLQPYHVYSHTGRGAGEYGAPIPVEHRYAIAFTVEMDQALIGSAPQAPGVMESARQYVEAARIGLQLGYLIRHLGYPARAHIDGNYRVIAPLVARDAGLGGIGRMGLLMTPELGPRVRLGVVTTDLPLVPDKRANDTSVIDFCRICNKCAQNCPSRSIPFDDRKESDSGLRWRIDCDSCFRYWNLVGTDCGVCMAVCPYSHPNNLPHNLVRWSLRQSGLARRAMLRMDDLFYGRKPPPRRLPAWVPQSSHASGAVRVPPDL